MATDLTLDKQICFPLYAASRLVIRLYQPLLAPLGLTYLQYIVMMILWEHGPLPVTAIGEYALLDTGTLSPLLKRLEQQGFVARRRSAKDERVVEIAPTKQGLALKTHCAEIPKHLFERVGLPLHEALALKTQIDRLLAVLVDRAGEGGGAGR